MNKAIIAITNVNTTFVVKPATKYQTTQAPATNIA